MVELCRSQLYRCYVIWGRQKKVLILPAGLIISTVGESPTTPLYTTAVMVRFPSLDSYRWSDIDLVGNTSAVARTPFILAAATNVVLVALTGK
jgi:hypothetical protein